MTAPIKKAVFPVAGLGTRFLPVTKAVPKEMLPLLDKPLIQYAIDEARAAGIEEFIFVTAQGKTTLVDYFDAAPYLIEQLQKHNADHYCELIEQTTLDSGCLACVRQHGGYGLGYAVYCARHLLDNNPFAIILADDVIATQNSTCLQQMIQAYHTENTNGHWVAAMDVPLAHTKNYGILNCASDQSDIILVRDMVEKPPPNKAPSNVAIIGRYIVQPSIINVLARQKPDAKGEIQLTNAIAETLKHNQNLVYGFRFQGQRFDCGSRTGFVQATLYFAWQQKELRTALVPYMKTLLDNQP